MIRVFVGCDPNHCDAESQMVLEHSIRSRTEADVEITWMKLSHTGPFSGWDSSGWATPFSGFRHGVPWLCGYEGRAIYTDSDVIFLADIRELWEAPMTKPVMAKSNSRLCVSLWDCAKVERVPIEKIKAGYRPQYDTEPLPGNWNCLDGEGQPLTEAKALHYTSMPHQPHLKYAIPRLARQRRQHWFDGVVTPHWRGDVQELFDAEYQSALNAGFQVKDYCHEPCYGKVRKNTNSSLRGARPRWG